jgi:hypothetical protein
MKTKYHVLAFLLVFSFLLLPLYVDAAKNITSFDSTQPRGFGGPDDPLHRNECVGKHGEVPNDAGQDLCAIRGGIWTPFYYLGNDGQGSQEGYFETWKGMMMGNGARDPAFFATLSTVNKDQINLFNAAAVACYPDYLASEAPAGTQCADVQMQLHNLLMDPGQPGYLTPVDALNFIGLYTAPYEAPDGTILEPVIHVDLSTFPYVLQPEELLPVAADLCLRCHFTTDWLEGRSEPPTSHSPYLIGQFWGSKFREYPGWPGEPELLPVDGDQPLDSEAGMEGIQCMYCHRQDDNYKRTSLYDGTTISNGIGGYFLMQDDPIFSNFLIRPTDNFQRDPFLCGTCHDVTNPIIKEQNTALTTGQNNPVPPTTETDYKHPIERTFTEWYWSDHGPGGGAGGGHCERCHLPMVFQGAQTWMIEGLDVLWGEVDGKWLDYYYSSPAITRSRTAAYDAAAQRSRDLMASTSDAADVDITEASKDENGLATVTVRITNEAGHKLPTGFAEGRQMWIHISAVDSAGNPVFESGYRKDFHGVQGLARYEEKVYGSPVTLIDPIKVYEHVSLAKNYDPFTLPDTNGCTDWNILDYSTGDPETGVTWQPDCSVSHLDKEFHFVLLNYVEKDNRIPPRGWIPEAYAADGAFVVDHAMPDYDRYIDENGDPINYDETTYTFDVSGAAGDVDVTVEVLYQTFNEHFMEFLDNVDTETMEYAGGRARNAPCTDRNPRDGSTAYCDAQTWGDILYDIWSGANYGQPVQVGNVASDTIRDGTCIPTGIPESDCNGIDDDCDGSIDEDYQPMQTSCGIGACASTGQTECVNGIESDTCTPGLPEPEVCDDTADNDCDGLTDCADVSDCSADPVCEVNCRDYTDEQSCTDAGCDWNARKERCR